jgi:HEPN domain-containing protein
MTACREEALRLLSLAKRDQAAFLALLGVESAGLSIACFHAQQAGEKAIKSVLSLRGIEFRRTHDLLALAGLLESQNISMPVQDDWLIRLTPYAVEFRYDDDPIHLISGTEAQMVIAALLHWAEHLISDAT